MDSLTPISRRTPVRLGARALLPAALVAVLSGCASTVDKTDIKDVYGPLGRLTKNRVEEAERIKKGDPYVGLAELNAARKLYDEQKYVEARKAFHKIAKNKKWKEEPVNEEALFYRAECDFQMSHYAAAQDGYDELLKNKGASKYLEKAVGRLFVIGCYWLNSPKPASDIELASFKEEDGADKLEQIPEANIPTEWHRIRPNFTDKTRPMFDSSGRAVQALKAVYIHDFHNPLAEKSMMILATYYLRKRDYREADSYFQQLRGPDHTNGKFQQAAYVLGAHASLKSYLGANYDGKQLEEAKKLTDVATRMFPDIPQKAKLDADLKKIHAEMIERDWRRVDYYLRRREKVSAAVYCESLIERFPDSPQAAKAREVLLKLGPQYAQGILTTPLFPKNAEKAKADPAAEPEEPGRLKVTDEGASPAPVEEQG